MWDLSSLTRDQTHVPCISRLILNHWTTREVTREIFQDLSQITTSLKMIPLSSLSILLYFSLPGKFNGRRSLADYNPWGHKESDMTELLMHKIKTMA